MTTMTSVSLRAFLRLGMDAEATETAKGGLEDSKICTVRIECYRVLGIVATRRGDIADAEAKFKAGLDEARDTGMWLLELLCARDLLAFVLEGTGRESEAEPLIEAACNRMGKPRSNFEELLAERRKW